MVGTANPASAANASSSSPSIFARERSVVSKRTLPVLMYVATSVNPAASTARTIASLRNWRLPMLIARRNPMYVATMLIIASRALGQALLDGLEEGDRLHADGRGVGDLLD